MVKFRCISLRLEDNTYTTDKGNTYLFSKGYATNVQDLDDIEYFRKNPYFQEEKEEIIKKIEEKIEEKLEEIKNEIKKEKPKKR